MSGIVPPQVARQAVHWMVELQADVVPDEILRAWSAWRAGHPDHERAWRHIEAVNTRLRGLGDPHPARAALLAPRGSGRRRQAVKAMSIAFFGAGAGWLARENTPWRAWTADQRTDVGERRMLALADGSRIALNTGSAVDIGYGVAARRLRLLRGEVLVTTAPDAARRPFFVDTAQGTIQAPGTRFAVRLREHATQVSVFDGAVELRPRDGDGVVLLKHGQQALFGSDTVLAPQAASEDSVAWIDGYLIARSQRLQDFLSELGRYTSLALDCAPALEGMRVSGSFRLDDVRRALDTVAATLGLDVESAAGLFGRRVARLRLTPCRS